MLKTQYESFVDEGFDKLGVFVMVIDGFPPDERFEPTSELLESLGYDMTPWRLCCVTEKAVYHRVVTESPYAHAVITERYLKSHGKFGGRRSQASGF